VVSAVLTPTRRHLNALFKGHTGRVHVFIGEEPYLDDNSKYTFKRRSEHRFDWPLEADLAEDEIIRQSHMHDVYVCPYLLSGERRTKGTSTARPHLHADIDGEIDLDLVRRLGGYFIGSGSNGHGHAYFPLTESVTHHQHEVLERALAAYLGADSKVADNDVLRPAGTFNYKATVADPPGERSPVVFVIEPEGWGKSRPEVIAADIGVELPDPRATASQDHRVADRVVEAVDHTVHPKVVAALADATGDRSVDTAKVVSACVAARLTLPQTRHVVNLRKDLRGRLDARTDDDVAKCFQNSTTYRAGLAEMHAQGNDDGRPVYPAPGAPFEVAKRIYRNNTQPGDEPLIAWRGSFWTWRGTHWAELDAADLRSRIYDELGSVNYLHPIVKNGEIIDYEKRPFNPNKRKVADVIESVAAVGIVPTELDPPSWITPTSWINPTTGEEYSAGKSQIISCRNGLLEVATRKLRKHNPEFFNIVSVPFNYNPEAPKPEAWLAFLGTLWPDDDDSVALLQEFIGYIVSGRTDMQKLLAMIGPTRSGKGTIGRMLIELVGKGHFAAPTLASLGTNFGMQPLLGKPLAIIGDVRLGNAPSHAVVQSLLGITGEDPMTVDRKFQQAWSGKLPTRLVIVSNELPKFSDSSGAIAGRMLILKMTKSFLGSEDRGLDARIKPELPGILNWALEGLDRLTRTGRFTVPASSEDAKNLMMDLSSPVSAFVRERCVQRPDHSVPRDVLYTVWRSWAEDNGHKVSDQPTFGRDLQAAVPGIKSSYPREDGRRRYHYAGIGLRPCECGKDLASEDSQRRGWCGECELIGRTVA
jgi:putative DNA primase/helicase